MKILKKISHKMRNSAIILFIRNMWNFRKELRNFYPWDYSFNLQVFKRSLELTKDYIEKYGNEIDETRIPKVEMMNRAIIIMNNIIDGNEIDQAEQILNKKHSSSIEFKKTSNDLYEMVDNSPEEQKEINKEIFALGDEIAEKQWEELWSIFKGNDKEGSDLRNWWD
jgi:hypothetical protein